MPAYTARKVMSTGVVTVRPEATLADAIDVLLANDVSGAPVVGEDGKLVGIISEFQLLEVIYDPKLKQAPVSRFMTTEVLSVAEDTLLSDVANLFHNHRIRRVPVLREGRLVGLISRPDLLRYAVHSEGEIAEFLESVMSAHG